MSGKLVTYLLQLPLSYGVEMNVYLVLDEKPARQDQKLKTLSKYVQQYPQGWKKRLELADLLYKTGNWEQALEEYRRVISRQPKLINVRLQLGKILQLMGKTVPAIEIYESALPLSDNHGTQHHINGLIAVCQGNNYKAITAFNLAATLEPDQVVHWLALAQVQMATENPIAALIALDQVLSLNPDDIVALTHSYDALMVVGNFHQAQRRLNKLIVLAGDDFRVRQRQLDDRCRMRLVSGKSGKQTKKLIGAALQQAPHGAEAYKSLADYHIYRGDWAQGVEILAQFSQKHPNNPSGWYYYGLCLFKTGKYQAAAEVMLKAYLLYPHDGEIYRALCEIAIASPPALVLVEENVTLALIVEEMLERFPERWSIWATAGRVLVQSLQEFERGCSVSVQGTKLQPQLADAWFCHGRVLALAQKHQEAVAAFTQGWQLVLCQGEYMQSVPAAVWLGESYQMLGNDGASRQWWEEACVGVDKLRAFNPVMADYWHGRALAGLGDSLGAIQAYRSALSQQLPYPAYEEVKEALKRLKTLVKKSSRG